MQKQVWQQVQQHIRQKWDIDLTIILSIAAGILNLFDIVSSKIAIGFILVIFSLIAVNILYNRWTDEELEKNDQERRLSYTYY